MVIKEGNSLVTLEFETIPFRIPKTILQTTEGVTCGIIAIGDYAVLKMPDNLKFRIPKAFIFHLGIKKDQVDIQHPVVIRLKAQGECVEKSQLTIEIEKT